MSDSSQAALYRPLNKVRFVTAAALFDGHDAAINIMRRLIQSMGCEVIHLGHNRSVQEVVNCALQEDVQGIAVSSYQGGHVEFFRYMVDALRASGSAHIQLFGGGGGVIVPDEIRELEAYGVNRIYSPEDGQRMGLHGMIADMIQRCDTDPVTLSGLPPISALVDCAHRAAAAPVTAGIFAHTQPLARWITALENEQIDTDAMAALRQASVSRPVPVLGITGTGGAGKSSLTDELIRRFRLDHDDQLRIAILSVDPTRRKSGGALLGDRIRMNAIHHPNLYMRSLATRSAGAEVSAALGDAIAACRVAGFDLILVETSGIGQGDAAIVPLVDTSLYVMTPEFGAASQLEKIDMLDFADFVAINKFDRRGALDALRDVSKQYQRNRERFSESLDAMPVYGTQAARFNDEGVTALYQAMRPRLIERGLIDRAQTGRLPVVTTRHSVGQNVIVPAARARYLAEIASSVRAYKAAVREQSTALRAGNPAANQVGCCSRPARTSRRRVMRSKRWRASAKQCSNRAPCGCSATGQTSRATTAAMSRW